MDKCSSEWLEMYASDVLDWHGESGDGTHDLFYRRMGIVESTFDSDGTLFEGRADIIGSLKFEVRTTLDYYQLQQRLVLAWVALCHAHPLLNCKALYAHEFKDCDKSLAWTTRCFVYERPKTIDQALRDYSSNTVFLEDHYPELDVDDFLKHVQNSARTIDVRKEMSKLFVMPMKNTRDGTIRIQLIYVLAHQISDGLSIWNFSRHFLDLLNLKEVELRDYLQRTLSRDMNTTLADLAPAQETLYPKRAGTRARQRWQWAITRILRHVRIPPPESFLNPLRRNTVLEHAVPLNPKYSKVLDYSRVPPLNSSPITAELPITAVEKLARLCREAKITVGSGCFTLVAIIMMQLEEQLHPDIPLKNRLPFVSGFPVNPRPFMSADSRAGKGESCMLAFSDGITLPFIPSDTDFVTKFKVLGRLAHRQLRHYQKRKNAKEEAQMGTRSPAQLLPISYLAALERQEGKIPEEMQVGYNPQGEYPASKPISWGTCGVSSVGDTSGLISSKYSIEKLGEKDLVADYRVMGNFVRPREGEFLVGAGGTKTSMGFWVSIDGNAIDPEKAQEWKRLVESIIDQQVTDEMVESRKVSIPVARENKI